MTNQIDSRRPARVAVPFRRPGCTVVIGGEPEARLLGGRAVLPPVADAGHRCGGSGRGAPHVWRACWRASFGQVFAGCSRSVAIGQPAADVVAVSDPLVSHHLP